MAAAFENSPQPSLQSTLISPQDGGAALDHILPLRAFETCSLVIFSSFVLLFKTAVDFLRLQKKKWRLTEKKFKKTLKSD